MSRAPRSRARGQADRLDTWVRRLVRLRWVMVAAWLVLLTLAAVGALGLGDRLSGGGWYSPGSESLEAVEASRSGFVGRGETTLTLVTRDTEHRAPEPEFAQRALEAYDHVRGLPGLQVDSAYGWATTADAARPAFVGESGRTTVTSLGLEMSDGDARRELPAIQESIDEHFADTGLLVALVGPASLWGEINVLSEHGLLRAELLALPLLLVIMLWIYRGWTAVGLSLAVAVTSVVWTLGLLSVVARTVDLSLFVQNAATMLGLGVAVDYSLFLISRYREQVLAGESGDDALATALRTAGHTVLSSGATVVIAMSTLFLVDLPVIRSLALGAVVVVSVAVVVNLVVLPALIAVAGRRVVGPQAKHQRRPRGPVRWERWAGLVMRHPVVSLATGAAVLAVLAAPATQLSTFTPDARILPPETTVRAGWEAVREDFGPGSASPINVVVRLDEALAYHPAAAEVLAIPERLERLDGAEQVASVTTVLEAAGVPDVVAALTPPVRAGLPPQLALAVDHYLSADGRTLVVQVVPDDTASSERARDLLEEVRATLAAEPRGVDIAAGGETAEGVDSNAAIVNGLPLVALTMLVAIYLLLMLTFRSLLLPLKAIAMNVASVAATYGALVLVFQRGWGADLLGFEVTGQVTNFVPVLLLTLLFSLSTDYEVFLLSRVREEWESGRSDTEAVSRGLALTAPLISGAAVLMVAVFSAFALAGVLPVQELGLGMAVAIVLDATVVRLLLVPASMRLMGRWNWWLPFSAPVRVEVGPHVPVVPSPLEASLAGCRRR